jgi:hypothetical protein
MDDLEKLVDIDFSFSPDEIFNHLSYVSKLLKNNNIKHWILFGTLLGAFREQDIIKHDHDFDLGILYEDYQKILELNSIIKKDGYSIEKAYGTLYKRNNPKQCERMWRVSLKINFNEIGVGDLFIFNFCEDGFLRRYDFEEKIYFYPKFSLPSFFITDGLTEIKIRESLFPSVKYPEILVKYCYGPHWNIPIKTISDGGNNHEDYDFWGNYLFSNLKFFIDFAFENFNIKLTPNFPSSNYEYIYPVDQIKWTKSNEI